MRKKFKLPKTLKVPGSLQKRVKINFRSVKLWTFVLLVAGLGLFGGAGYYWYNNVFTDTDRIFYGMVSKSLETDSVSRTIVQQEQTRSESQSYYLTFTPVPILHSRSTVEQIDETRQKSSVSTETIGTKTADFVRYTDINIPKQQGDNADYSKVVNTWAKRDDASGGGQGAQFLNESIFSFIPFGNFDQADRDKLLQMLKDKKAYRIEGAKVTYENFRPQLSVNVLINPRALVEVLVEYEKITGIGNKEQLNPEQYENRNSYGVTMKVDVFSRHLKEIGYGDSPRKEVYEAYGLNRPIELPDKTISVEELQGKLQPQQQQ